MFENSFGKHIGSLFLILFLSVCFLGFPNPADSASLKKSLGIADFNNQSKWKEPWNLSVQVPTMLNEALRATHLFVVHDRPQLTSALKELDLPPSDEATAITGEPGGRYIPVQILVTGTITDFEYAQGKKSGGFGWKKFRVGGGKDVAFVSMVLRLMDTTTGEVLNTKRVEGRGSRGKFSKGTNVDKLVFGSEDFLKTPMGKAMKVALDRGIDFIKRETKSFPFRSRVLAIRENVVYTDAGQNSGIKKGQNFQVLRFPAAVYDAESGLSLTSKPQPIGHLKINSIKEKFSTGQSPQSIRIRRGDIIQSLNKPGS